MRTWKLPADVDTDQLAPGTTMKHGIEVTARHCLEAVRPEFALEVRPGDDHVAAPHPECELGTKRLEAVARGHLDAVLHRRAGGELVGVDVGREFPGPHACSPSVAPRAWFASI